MISDAVAPAVVRSRPTLITFLSFFSRPLIFPALQLHLPVGFLLENDFIQVYRFLACGKFDFRSIRLVSNVLDFDGIFFQFKVLDFEVSVVICDAAGSDFVVCLDNDRGVRDGVCCCCQ